MHLLGRPYYSGMTLFSQVPMVTKVGHIALAIDNAAAVYVIFKSGDNGIQINTIPQDQQDL